MRNIYLSSFRNKTTLIYILLLVCFYIVISVLDINRLYNDYIIYDVLGAQVNNRSYTLKIDEETLNNLKREINYENIIIDKESNNIYTINFILKDYRDTPILLEFLSKNNIDGYLTSTIDNPSLKVAENHAKSFLILSIIIMLIVLGIIYFIFKSYIQSIKKELTLLKVIGYNSLRILTNKILILNILSLIITCLLLFIFKASYNTISDINFKNFVANINIFKIMILNVIIAIISTIIAIIRYYLKKKKAISVID